MVRESTFENFYETKNSYFSLFRTFYILLYYIILLLLLQCVQSGLLGAYRSKNDSLINI